ncbi:MAG: lysine transporter LysE [Pseudomonadales bacterium]|jgi:RhtB (resistance to homoserine/threonine) family protein|uniref:LysE family translocator n=1 Tax=Halopseudomonas sp. TaxID=2901191 RepID=UPI000C9044E5|nr:lysine transporter LysE [Pseudomonadales bacterium]|tara:strand:- start:21565 stop:22197 length:633 start_codon:yes stop_codon:yes gene_type:complete
MYLNEFLLVALVHLLAVISPGPDFAVVIRNSVSAGHRIGLYTAIGIGLGIFVHVAYSLLGIGLIVSQSVWLFNLMKLLAAAYLLYIGVRALQAQPASADSALSETSRLSARQAFVQGFITNGLNPKATLFFLSLFTAVISHDTPLLVQAGYGVYLAFATGAWFCLVAMLFSREVVRRTFNRLGHWFDRLMGGVLIGLGLHLALSQWLKRD